MDRSALADSLKKIRRMDQHGFGDKDLALVFCAALGVKQFSGGVAMTSARSTRFYPGTALSKWYTGSQDDAVSFVRRCHDLCPGVENAITGYFEGKLMRCNRCGAERQRAETWDQRTFRVLELECINEDR